MNVEITGLTRRFGRTMAVAGADLQAGPGVFGLLGPNGAGKTSLLRIMATAVPPTSGRLRLLGRDPGRYGPRQEIRRRLGYLPQNLGYYPGFTVAEFVEYFALLKEMPPARVPQAVATAIELVDLGGKARARLRTLSGGMLRRAGIAQAIVNEPELLLLDEPTAGLDPEQRVAFRGLLRDLGERATVIVSTPLVAALFWFDSYRPSIGAGPLYGLRTFWNLGQGHTIIDFGPFVAGVAAWMGSRDGRRGMRDLVAGTARPRWVAELATWAATALWAVTAYLAFVGVMFAVYAEQGVAGSPPW